MKLTPVIQFPAVQAVSATALPLPSGAATDATLQDVGIAIADLKFRLAKLLEALGTTDPQQRLRVNIDAGILPTVTSVTNVAANAGMDREQYINQARVAADCVRSKISFS